MTVLLHLIAVNYGGSSQIGPLLDSLSAQSPADWRLTIVDNSESADELTALRALTGDDRAEVIAAPRNLGYLGAAYWLAVRYPVAATWTAVCNVDLELDADFCATLGALEAPPTVVAPHIVALPSGRAQNPFMLERPTGRHMLVRRLALSNRLTAALAKRRAATRPLATSSLIARPIYAPHGAFMLFHRRFFESGGSLHHPTFLFNEEITVAETARRLQLSVGFEPSLRVVHREHQATGAGSSRIFTAQRESSAYAHRLITGRLGDRQA